MNNITMRIMDTVDNLFYELLEVPLEKTNVDGKTTLETLDGNVFTNVTYHGKRAITHTWAYMTEDEYRALETVERRQYETFLRPLLTIDRLGIENLPVVLEITNPQKIVSNCGTVQGVSISMRETIQNSIGG